MGSLESSWPPGVFVLLYSDSTLNTQLHIPLCAVEKSFRITLIVHFASHSFIVKLLSLVLHSFVPVLWTHSFKFYYILHFTFIYALTLHYNYLISVTHCENFAPHSSALHSTNNVKCVNCKNMEQNSAQSQLSITLHFPSKAVFHSKSDSKIFESITYSKIVKDTVQKSAAGVSGLRIMTLTLASSPQHYLVNLNVFCCFYSVFLFSLQKDGPYWTPIYVWPISTTFQNRCVRLIKTEASWPPPSTLSASHLLKTETGTEPKEGTETET